MIGKTLSHYKIIEKIGQGGMGEVYRAEDTNLSREVAIKVLPEQFTQDPQRLARFEREAKLLASLNHPNIAAIYGLEEADGVRFLALELVPGETLADRVARGPLPVEEALEICRQIAEGMEAAHEKGVIHRDLKPANVKVTPEGQVKILDFGLAKAFEAEVPVTDISQSPTLTEEMTRAGVILGTAAYMSPEQARGKQVDKRADIFAFGCLLYELLTSKRAFGGETVTDTLAKVLEGEPDWRLLPGTIPSTIRFLMSRCLQKKPGKRLQHIDGARILIEEALTGATNASAIEVGGAIQSALWKRAIPWSVAFIAVAAAGMAMWRVTTPTPVPLMEFMITPPPSAALTEGGPPDLAISPDGRHVIYRATGEKGRTQLYLRALDDVAVTQIPGTEDANFHFFSADGNSVAFAVAGKLKKVSLMGGPPTTLCDASTFAAGSWSAEDTIVFAASTRGLYRVSASGGEPEVLVVPDENGEDYQHAEILPGGKAVLFTMRRDNNYRVHLLSLETGEHRVLLEAARQAHYAATGHLIYAQPNSGTLMAAPFDLTRLEVTGDPVAVLEGVRQNTLFAVDYSFSSNGTLVYVSGEESPEYSLLWVDREGREQRITEEKGDFLTPRVSPDGTRIALTILDQDGSRNVWVHDLQTDSLRRLTFEGSVNSRPVWTPDGQWITFVSDRGGSRALYRKPADGSGQAELLTESEYEMAPGPNSWSPDGSVLAFRIGGPNTGNSDIWTLPLEGDREPQPFISSPHIERGPVFSPDGRWLAYASTETGSYSVYVTPYPEPEVKWLVSDEDGGIEPVWSPDGSELFYRRGEEIMVVSVATEPTFSSGKPSVLLEGSSYRSSTISPGYPYYDISPDGQRFLMLKKEQGRETQIHVVLNWFEELKRLVPTN